MNNVIYGLGIWLGCGLLAAGFMNAHERRERHDRDDDYRARRDTLSFYIGLGCIWGPFALLMSFFLTGFWQDGWTLTLAKEEEKAK